MLVAGCSDDDGPGASESGALAGESFVLVHGAWNGDWVWDEVKQRLEGEGAQVRTLTLAAHADDKTPVTETSLAAYAEQVGELLSEDEPATLVGHSFGGVVISVTAEAYASRIKQLVYVGAFLPSDGDTALGLAMTDGDSDLGPALSFDMDRGVVGIDQEQFPELFCADCSDADLKILAEKYSDEPLPPLTESIDLSEAEFGSVPKYYVFTGEDHVLSPAFQKRMAAGWELTDSATIQTSHSPFFSAPELLVETIGDLVKQ